MRSFVVLITLLCSAAASAQTVFVAGGSGRSGIEIVRTLQDAGYDVRASTRNAAQAATRYPDVKTWVEVDAHDTAQLRTTVVRTAVQN